MDFLSLCDNNAEICVYLYFPEKCCLLLDTEMRRRGISVFSLCLLCLCV